MENITYFIGAGASYYSLPPDADTSKLENQLDEMIYKLYELTEEKIKVVEGK